MYYAMWNSLYLIKLHPLTKTLNKTISLLNYLHGSRPNDDGYLAKQTKLLPHCHDVKIYWHKEKDLLSWKYLTGRAYSPLPPTTTSFRTCGEALTSTTMSMKHSAENQPGGHESCIKNSKWAWKLHPQKQQNGHESYIPKTSQGAWKLHPKNQPRGMKSA